MRRGNQKLITRITVYTCYMVMAMAVLFSLVGCGTFQDMPTETKVVVSYESMGAVLETALPTLQGLCDAGIMNPEDCAEAKKAYNEAVAIYKFLGDVATTVMDTGDDSSYKIMSIRLIKLLTQIQAYGSS